MIRQTTLAIAALAFAAASLASADANAKPGFGGGGFKPGKVFVPKGPIKMAPVKPVKLGPFKPIKPIKPVFPIKPIKPHGPHHHHAHGPHFIPVPMPVTAYAVERPVTVVTQRPVTRSTSSNTCNCLTKDYTPDGIVIFKDLCTQETASAPLPGSPAAAALEQQQKQQQQSEVPAANNFAGKTFEEFKAAQAATTGDAPKN
ncbi:MAG: hypothetical protein AB7U62_08195 [Pseudolabrys sp.]